MLASRFTHERADKLVKRIASTTAVLLLEKKKTKTVVVWGFKFRDREED
jgi:hypothetical protein